MAVLVAVRGATGQYLVAAEKIGWKWLEVVAEDEDENNVVKGDETVILITKWGQEIIAVVVVKVQKKEKKGLIRAWTTGLRYRGKGVGKDLLEQGVDVALGRGCREVVFDEKHASEFSPFHLVPELCPKPWIRSDSTRVLPTFFNRTFDRREQRARKTLAVIVAARKGEKRLA